MIFLRFLFLAAASFGLAACSSFQQPIDHSNSNFDPLRPAGASISDLKEEIPSGPRFSPGSFAQTIIPDAAFFSSIPKGNAKASRLVKRGESVKVISQQKSYVKVELEDGSIGYMPAIMLSTAESENEVAVAGSGVDRNSIPTIPDLPDPVQDPGSPGLLSVPPLPDFREEPASLPDEPLDLPKINDAPSAPKINDPTATIDAPNVPVVTINPSANEEVPPPLPEPEKVTEE